jgi:anti-sigma regulatory factor (Ser/Thr protein kinase)
MTRLHFQPIQGKIFAIIDAILRTEEVASGGKMPDGIHLGVEEVVVNIAEHACLDDTNGSLDVEINRQDERIILCFRDGGIPFNPLEQDPPDTSLPMSQRPMGGLGIKYVDTIAYEYTNNKNVLTVSLKTNLSAR